MNSAGSILNKKATFVSISECINVKNLILVGFKDALRLLLPPAIGMIIGDVTQLKNIITALTRDAIKDSIEITKSLNILRNFTSRRTKRK